MTQIFDPPTTHERPGPDPTAMRRSFVPARAVAGGLLVVVATVGTWSLQRSGSGQPDTSFVVARHDIAPGHTIKAADLALEPMDLAPGTAAAAWPAVEDVVGSVALGPIGEHEVVQRSAVAPPPGGDGGGRALHEVTLPVESGAVPPALRPGERVDVVATYGTGSDAYTEVVARSATVIGADDGGDDAFATSGTVALTLGVLPDEVLPAVHAARIGGLTVVRTTGVGRGEAASRFQPTPVDDPDTASAEHDGAEPAP
jgi:pilus assembly protein CpaB